MPRCSYSVLYTREITSRYDDDVYDRSERKRVFTILYFIIYIFIYIYTDDANLGAISRESHAGFRYVKYNILNGSVPDCIIATLLYYYKNRFDRVFTDPADRY